MKRFTFRLENVLRHRETLETLREQEMLTAQGRLQGAEAGLARLWQSYRDTVAARPEAAHGTSLNAAAIASREQYILTIQARIEEQERVVEAAQIAFARTQAALVDARQAREVVSRLKEREQAAHQIALTKAEQDTLDEMATQRFVRDQAA